MEQQTETLTIEQQLAQAEERGYQRGLNEQLTRKMAEPGEWEEPQSASAAATDGSYQILSTHRQSIWEI